MQQTDCLRMTGRTVVTLRSKCSVQQSEGRTHVEGSGARLDGLLHQVSCSLDLAAVVHLIEAAPPGKGELMACQVHMPALAHTE